MRVKPNSRLAAVTFDRLEDALVIWRDHTVRVWVWAEVYDLPVVMMKGHFAAVFEPEQPRFVLAPGNGAPGITVHVPPPLEYRVDPAQGSLYIYHDAGTVLVASADTEAVSRRLRDQLGGP